MSSPSRAHLSKTTPCFVCGEWEDSDTSAPLQAEEFESQWRVWLRAFWERRHPHTEGPAATRALRTCHPCAAHFKEDGLGRCASVLAGAAGGHVCSNALRALPSSFLRPLARELLCSGTAYRINALWPQGSPSSFDLKRTMEAFTRLLPPDAQPRWGYFGSRGTTVVTFANLLGLSGLPAPAETPSTDARPASLETALRDHVRQRVAATFNPRSGTQTAERQEAEQAKLRELLVAGDSHAYLHREYGADLPRAVLRLVGGSDQLLPVEPSAATQTKAPQQQRLSFTLALICGLLVALRCEISNTHLPKPALAAFLSVALRTLSHNQLVKLLAPSGLVTGVKYVRAHTCVARRAQRAAWHTGRASSSGSLCQASSAPST